METLTFLGYMNPVLNTYDIVSTLYLEALLWDVFFEFFVSDILSDFIIFDALTNEKNGRLFPRLNIALDDFTSSGNLIITSLANCNA